MQIQIHLYPDRIYCYLYSMQEEGRLTSKTRLSAGCRLSHLTYLKLERAVLKAPAVKEDLPLKLRELRLVKIDYEEAWLDHYLPALTQLTELTFDANHKKNMQGTLSVQLPESLRWE